MLEVGLQYIFWGNSSTHNRQPSCISISLFQGMQRWGADSPFPSYHQWPCFNVLQRSVSITVVSLCQQALAIRNSSPEVTPGKHPSNTHLGKGVVELGSSPQSYLKETWWNHLSELQNLYRFPGNGKLMKEFIVVTRGLEWRRRDGHFFSVFKSLKGFVLRLAPEGPSGLWNEVSIHPFHKSGSRRVLTPTSRGHKKLTWKAQLSWSFG